MSEEKRIWDFLYEKIGNAYGAAGLMGNLKAESSLEPTNLQNVYEKKLGITDEEYTRKTDDGSYKGFVHDAAGYGLAQWTFWTRKDRLLKLAKARGTSVGDLGTQLEYLWEEMKSYINVLQTLKSAESVREASDKVLLCYEIPADQSEEMKIKRAEYGMEFFEKYAADSEWAEMHKGDGNSDSERQRGGTLCEKRADQMPERNEERGQQSWTCGEIEKYAADSEWAEMHKSDGNSDSLRKDENDLSGNKADGREAEALGEETQKLPGQNAGTEIWEAQGDNKRLESDDDWKNLGALGERENAQTEKGENDLAVKRMPISKFVARLEEALNRKDGYIMGATGQNPKNWSVTSWWFTQYSGEQKNKALYWRENARRVWDCNGLAEGLYKDYSGTDINTRARYNYAQWCGIKGSGMIPANRRVPGAAVFWGNKAADIHHVAYLYKPVTVGNPEGDWYLIEARGVMYGVVMTKLMSRKPNFWGIMDKYFDYGGAVAEEPVERHLGDRILRNGDEGEDVKQLQTNLIRLGYDCGKWGADGDFGDGTELAVKAFQRSCGLEIDGEYGPKTHAALEATLAAFETPAGEPRMVEIRGGQCYIRAEPNTSGAKMGIAKEGSVWPFAGFVAANGWPAIYYNAKVGYVSDKYGKLKE